MLESLSRVAVKLGEEDMLVWRHVSNECTGFEIIDKAALVLSLWHHSSSILLFFRNDTHFTVVLLERFGAFAEITDTYQAPTSSTWRVVSCAMNMQRMCTIYSICAPLLGLCGIIYYMDGKTRNDAIFRGGHVNFQDANRSIHQVADAWRVEQQIRKEDVLRT
ncbi:hypothetical protein PIB30_031843 [Stylosanthes scabra]|uniref:Uncharacterized protein n=1 Tax=Stylosanthes scabra TaxID=79078 RepID=A0ABU6TBP0_9FABA|nr:hypothetical protein [Stylosanthes scabra]